jgi:hypothetical protein
MVEVEPLKGTPRVVIEVDGEKVAERDLRGGDVVVTPVLKAPPYFRHLAVRCLGPEGSEAVLKRTSVKPAE